MVKKKKKKKDSIVPLNTTRKITVGKKNPLKQHLQLQTTLVLQSTIFKVRNTEKELSIQQSQLDMSYGAMISGKYLPWKLEVIHGAREIR